MEVKTVYLVGRILNDYERLASARPAKAKEPSPLAAFDATGYSAIDAFETARLLFGSADPVSATQAAELIGMAKIVGGKDYKDLVKALKNTEVADRVAITTKVDGDEAAAEFSTLSPSEQAAQRQLYADATGEAEAPGAWQAKAEAAIGAQMIGTHRALVSPPSQRLGTANMKSAMGQRIDAAAMSDRDAQAAFGQLAPAKQTQALADYSRTHKPPSERKHPRLYATWLARAEANLGRKAPAETDFDQAVATLGLGFGEEEFWPTTGDGFYPFDHGALTVTKGKIFAATVLGEDIPLSVLAAATKAGLVGLAECGADAKNHVFYRFENGTICVHLKTSKKGVVVIIDSITKPGPSR